MPRSIKKGPFVDHHLLEKLLKLLLTMIESQLKLGQGDQ